jgi:RNA-directed DNA polymerase
LVVDGSNAQEPVDLYFDGDDLFAPFQRRRGLPIGNLTSHARVRAAKTYQSE